MANIWIDQNWLGEEYSTPGFYFETHIWEDMNNDWKLRVEDKDWVVKLKAKTGEEAKAEAEGHLKDLLEKELEHIKDALHRLGD